VIIEMVTVAVPNVAMIPVVLPVVPHADLKILNAMIVGVLVAMIDFLNAKKNQLHQ
jgi:hypothetical protein